MLIRAFATTHAFTHTAQTMVMAAIVLAMLTTSSALAFERDPGERDRLRECERRLCEIILKRETTGEALTCELQKTWVNDEISGGIGAKGLDWAFGDARCTVSLNVPQAILLHALTYPSFELEMPKHPVNCELDSDGEITPVTLSLAPKVSFEDGKATAASLQISDVEGDSIIATAIGGVAKLEEWTGLFQSEIADEVNEFVGEKCAKRYPELAQ